LIELNCYLININNDHSLNDLINEINSILTQYDEQTFLSSDTLSHSNVFSITSIFIFNSISKSKINFG